MFAIFREVTPLVEPLSLDEAYLDVTENAWGEPLATAVARRLKERIRADTGLTASAGVAPNKFLAKIASGWKKPDGLTVISPDRVEPFLQQLPVDALWGVGPVTARKLRARGIERLVDVRTRRSGSCCARRSAASPTGCGSWPTASTTGRSSPNREAKSSGSENTYPAGSDRSRRRSATRSPRWRRMPSRWLARKQLLARTVTIKVRYADFTTITRSHSAPPTREPADITDARRAAAGEDRRRPPAGPAARRQRPQFLWRGGSPVLTIACRVMRGAKDVEDPRTAYRCRGDVRHL